MAQVDTIYWHYLGREWIERNWSKLELLVIILLDISLLDTAARAFILNEELLINSLVRATSLCWERVTGSTWTGTIIIIVVFI